MTPHDDPYRHFEQLAHPDTEAFAEAEHRRTQSWLEQQPDYAALRQDILTMLQDEKQIPFCQEHRARMYHFHLSAEFPKGVYRVCSAASYRAGLPEWEVLFSVADFDDILGADVYLEGVSHHVENPERALLFLSPDGGDACFTVEFDLAARQIVANGFHFPAGKNHIAWRDADSVWVCPAWDERQLTASGYPREVWLMRRGQSFEEAQPVLQTPAESVLVHAWRYLDGQGAPIDLIEEASGFFSKQYYQVDAEGTPRPLGLPENCEVVGYLGGQLLVQLRDGWTRANRRYAAGSLLAVKLNKGVLGEACCLFEPQHGQSVESVETTKRFVVASLLDNVSGSLRAWRFRNGNWEAVEQLPALPSGALELTDQPWGGDVLYIAASDFLTPLTLYSLDLQRMELCVLRRQQPQFDPAGLAVQQHWAASADGTAVPYYHIGSGRTDAPTIVYAYGGFGVPELPHYLGTIGRHWLARGGAFVLANLRGGGEFGPQWHAAAQGAARKHKSVDDLLAVAADLAERQLARPERIALQGGSNGGLITAAAYCRAPERIGALVCEVPLTDMLRYPLLSAGASWLEEYGDPADSADAGYLKALSPYHNIAAGRPYPPALITTHLSDDRVHPAHALKFHARLQENGAPSRLYAPATGGHTGNASQEETAAELAAVLVFLRHALGKPAK
ncbi:prolyl oligopeptidase family serine peptidase [Neisseria shayeganii]|uniref:S9 family peptidase n=1 Tax=Neisseria shayeganii TaxID=607712 RepID=A0A7D7SH50_9NEIS|nr:prolyl oligopeptidase family serine peptidase [Neisseria shayeganii]QMT40609.1 S9 family peptidase [Neisseria shayeganii]